MYQSRLLAVLATGVAVAALVCSSVAAIAASGLSPTTEELPRPDPRAPRLKVAPIEFIVGESIDATVPDTGECDLAEWHHAVPMRLSWMGRDGGQPIDHYDVWRIPTHSEPYQVVDDSDQTTLDVPGGDYDSSCGDGSHFDSHRIEAYDEDGNVAMVEGDTRWDMDAWQEDGYTKAFFDDMVTFAWYGSWKRDTCTCSDAGHTVYSTKAGDKATFTVRPRWGGKSFALVMPMDANRGKITIAVDGGTPVTVDTYAASAQHRKIVWQTRLSRGDHTVVVTNLGTAGRSRVDIDAVMLS